MAGRTANANACACLDHCSCPLQVKVQFLVFWTILHAIIGILALFLYPFHFQEEFKWPLLIVLVVHLISGIMMFISLIYQERHMFIFGLISSCIMPVFYVYLVYLPIVQIVFTIAGCRFYKLGMHDSL
ncbi:uncharacterized protein LOC26527388 isoform X2 [Drosophila mojavensis]|uniref:Uncharacterized protein n=1 Tax=Drosophila mojavensis TaxID=7230 RepID=A0A0Q9X449_DROMO|nr:uncharacterized protein LOC26527388 isoform X2 [Drosophila mojavensis]XP_043864571.1 uncharacterized protein LOC26527388 isoform X2 [Drosophila mojavensis]KRG02747.1 uncharacterized protein Dmoj_GI25747 [Drosophila mojavensis]